MILCFFSSSSTKRFGKTANPIPLMAALQRIPRLSSFRGNKLKQEAVDAKVTLCFLPEVESRIKKLPMLCCGAKQGFKFQTVRCFPVPTKILVDIYERFSRMMFVR